MKRAHNLPLLAVLVCLAMLAPLGVAHADSVVRRDAVGDVVVDSGDGAKHTAQRNRYADITRFRLTHDRTRVRVSMRVRNLQRRDFVFSVSLRTPRSRFVYLVPKSGVVNQAFLVDAKGDPKKCRGDRHRVDHRRNLLSFSVPRTCLGQPKWVRAGGALSVAGTSGQFDRVDYSHRRGAADTVTSMPIGPRVYR